MTKYICDKCSREIAENLLTRVSLRPTKAFSYMEANNLLEGISRIFDLCPECLQKVNWAIVGVVNGSYDPINPTVA